MRLTAREMGVNVAGLNSNLLLEIRKEGSSFVVSMSKLGLVSLNHQIELHMRHLLEE